MIVELRDLLDFFPMAPLAWLFFAVFAVRDFDNFKPYNIKQARESDRIFSQFDLG